MTIFYSVIFFVCDNFYKKKTLKDTFVKRFFFRTDGNFCEVGAGVGAKKGGSSFTTQLKNQIIIIDDSNLE